MVDTLAAYLAFGIFIMLAIGVIVFLFPFDTSGKKKSKEEKYSEMFAWVVTLGILAFIGYSILN